MFLKKKELLINMSLFITVVNTPIVIFITQVNMIGVQAPYLSPATFLAALLHCLLLRLENAKINVAMIIKSNLYVDYASSKRARRKERSVMLKLPWPPQSPSPVLKCVMSVVEQSFAVPLNCLL